MTKKDWMHAVRVTFGGVLRSEVKGEFCRIRILFDVQKQLRRGVFIDIGDQEKVWLPFKYENLPQFCYGCGRMGHGLKECIDYPLKVKEMIEDDLLFLVALKAESNVMGKEYLMFNYLINKLTPQRSYIRE